MQQLNIDVILAAIVHESGGSIEVSAEAIEADFSDLAMALDYDNDREVLSLRLVPKDAVVYDESE